MFHGRTMPTRPSTKLKFFRPWQFLLRYFVWKNLRNGINKLKKRSHLTMPWGFAISYIIRSFGIASAAFLFWQRNVTFIWRGIKLLLCRNWIIFLQNRITFCEVWSITKIMVVLPTNWSFFPMHAFCDI